MTVVYLRVDGEVPGAPTTHNEMQAFMERVMALEAEMEASGTFVFGGALHDPEAATVVRLSDGDVVMTDGLFAESKEHIAGSTSSTRTISMQPWPGLTGRGRNQPSD